MNRPELDRRSFLGGLAGVGGTSSVGPATGSEDGPASPAFSLPGIESRHHVKWQFSGGEETTIYPTVVADGTVVTIVRRPRHEQEENDDATANRPRFDLVGLSKADKSVQWRHEFREYPSLPELVDGAVLLQTQQRVQAFDVTTGEKRWTFEQENYRAGNPLIADGRVFVTALEEGPDSEVILHALDVSDGETEWKQPYGGENGSPLIARHVENGVLYAGGDRNVIAVNTSDGSEQWRATVGQDRPRILERQGDALYVWVQNALVALEARSGAERWRKTFESLTIHQFRGAVTDGTVFVWGQKLLALNARTGARRWTFDPWKGTSVPEEERGHAPAVVTVEDGTVYTGVGEQLYAVDADSGAKRWEWTTDTRFHDYWGGISDGIVYALGEQAVYGLDANSGNERWTYQLDERVYWTEIEGGDLFFGTESGTLYAVDRPSPLVTAPVATLFGAATSGPGLAVLGLAGVGVLAAGYRRKQRAARPDVELGRLGRLGTGPLTETYRKRVQTADGTAVVAETQLTERADEQTAAEFAEGVERWADLDVSGVLPIQEYGTDPRPWFETPYAEGGSLADCWPVAAVQRVEAVSAAARTLHAAHDEGVVHGTLSPASVFLPSPGRGENARVGGWFLSDSVVESPAGYAAPEQPDEQTPQTDVYRLAALGYHLLTGVVPTAEPTLPSALNPALPSEVDDVLMTGLAADPEDRHESALKFDDLFRWAALER
ncbi:outer membrane protein assembly factor BamB family protein [Halorussus halophilus]|uniref:outer membrane protein assembly factor BamB family protein n=1 Tax=Halorussus halophilus TaxID=2650975 RepID=UPI00130159A7|nr:PQQ-binding-like beta-propeller repeat protein [Halorussus halophilus]